MRTKNSLLNIISAFSGQMIALIAAFIVRLIFVQCLSQEYLGLTSVFSSVLTMLSLAELGIGPAMTFAMYKPLAENNVEEIKGLMQLYKKAYISIGCVILGLGLLFIPFYPYFISTDTEIHYLTLIYMLYVVNTAVSYFYSYKRSILEADQKKYRYNILHYVIYSIMNLAQGIGLLLYRNYIVYLIIQIAFTWTENVLVSKMADHFYPYIKEKEIAKLSQTVTQSIWRNVKAMIFHKIGRMVVQSTDALLLSKFFDLAVSGIYANYTLISSAVSTIVSQIFNSVTASVGNLSTTGNQKKILEVFNKLLFLNAWLYGVTTTCFINLYQPFICLIFGKEYLFNDLTMLMFSLSFYTSGMRQAVNIYKDANGLFYKDWFKPIIESLVNLVASIILLKVFGHAGVFMGTIISNVFISGWIEACITYKYVLKESVIYHLKLLVKYVFVFATGCVLACIINHLIYGNGYISFATKCVVSFAIPNVLYSLFFFCDWNFRYFVNMGKTLIQRHHIKN